MDVLDDQLFSNQDWDPCYLQDLFSTDFNDFTDHWKSLVTDADLNTQMDKVEKYCLVVEDISIEDEVLYNAVEKIENE